MVPTCFEFWVCLLFVLFCFVFDVFGVMLCFSLLLSCFWFLFGIACAALLFGLRVGFTLRVGLVFILVCFGFNRQLSLIMVGC